MSGLAVAAGAFGAHALRARLAPGDLLVFETGARYQMYHGLALIAAGWAAERWPGPLASAAGWCFLIGIVLFSGSLYALTFGAPRPFGIVTPFGGVALIAGWICFAVGAWRATIS